MITIGGKNYNVTWVKGSLTQTADIINGSGSGRIQGTYSMYLEPLGTFFNHKGQLRRERDCTDKEWDEVYLLFANPMNSFTMTFPFGSEQLLTQKVYNAKISRALLFSKDKNTWEKVYDVELPAMESAWRAGKKIVGLSG